MWLCIWDALQKPLLCDYEFPSSLLCDYGSQENNWPVVCYSQIRTEYLDFSLPTIRISRLGGRALKASASKSRLSFGKQLLFTYTEGNGSIEHNIILGVRGDLYSTYRVLRNGFSQVMNILWKCIYDLARGGIGIFATREEPFWVPCPTLHLFIIGPEWGNFSWPYWAKLLLWLHLGTQWERSLRNGDIRWICPLLYGRADFTKDQAQNHDILPLSFLLPLRWHKKFGPLNQLCHIIMS